jgi:hypothetical protein
LKVNPDLLNDLARLTKKYKPKEWEQLSRLLEDPKQLEEFRLLLRELTAVSKKQSRPRKKAAKSSKATKVRKSLDVLRKEDPDRAAMLEDIWLKLRQRDLLPTIAAVRAFGEIMGLKGLESSRRDQAVTELMELFLDLPAEALEEKMRQTVVEDRRLGDEYDAWVDLILRRPRQPNVANQPPSPSK